MTNKLAELAAGGAKRIGVYGAGQHTERLADVLAASPVPVAAILDDDPARAGGACAGLPIALPRDATRLAIDAVVISTDQFEDQVWRRRSELTDRGIAVHRLYGDGPTPTPYESAWDRYARHWQPTTPRLAWNETAHIVAAIDDQSGIEMPGDEWGVAGTLYDHYLASLITADDVVLEIGPGSGRVTEHALARSRELHAVEVSSEMIEALRRRLGQPANLVVHKVSDVDLSAFADDTFDVAFSIGVFVHLCLEDMYRYLRDLRRVLKPGRRFVIDGVMDLGTDGGWHHFLRKVAEYDAGQRQDPWRFHFTTREILDRFCRDIGWAIEPGPGLRFRSLKA